MSDDVLARTANVTDAPQRRHPTLVLSVLSVVTAVTVIAFLTIGAEGAWQFVLPFRGRRLLAIVLVASAIAISTIVFQTVTENRILTPSILGFDALFVLIQTVLVFVVGAVGLGSIPRQVLFVGELVLMVGLSLLLFRLLIGSGGRSLHLLVLVGVVCGALFRSSAGFLQRLIDPNEFVVLQDRLFASFNAVEPDLLALSTVIVVGAGVALWQERRHLDALGLGRDLSIALGVDHPRAVFRLLVIIAVLVSVSTALVGPITFLGLLVAALAHQVAGSHRHAVVLPVAVLIAVIALVGGQAVLEHVFGLDGVLGVLVELVGGVLFLVLVARAARR